MQVREESRAIPVATLTVEPEAATDFIVAVVRVNQCGDLIVIKFFDFRQNTRKQICIFGALTNCLQIEHFVRLEPEGLCSRPQ
jgi:hypothetical protein